MLCICKRQTKGRAVAESETYPTSGAKRRHRPRSTSSTGAWRRLGGCGSVSGLSNLWRLLRRFGMRRSCR